MDIKGLIDDRNLELWNYLNVVQDIEIILEKRDDYLVFSKGNISKIYVPVDRIDTAAFTHEILHIYLRTKDVFIGGGLARSIMGSEKLSSIFSMDLIDHIGNCLDHIKMLPLFLNLGFTEREFISDYSVNKLTDEDILSLKRNYTTTILFKKVYVSSEVDFFIGKYFAANSCPNRFHDYQGQLKKLEKIDPSLFQILERFLEDWRNFDYNNNDPIYGGYNSLLYNFIEGLEEWTEGKIIV